MEYKGKEYQVVQTANPNGWKWTVTLDDKRTRTGSGHSRNAAIALAQSAIDKLLQRRRSTLGAAVMKIPGYTGHDANNPDRPEIDPFGNCPVCGALVDMRDLGQVLAHMHGQEIEELNAPPLDS
jgi:hypothetical protein